jgi:hypothetical protein
MADLAQLGFRAQGLEQARQDGASEVEMAVLLNAALPPRDAGRMPL